MTDDMQKIEKRDSLADNDDDGAANALDPGVPVLAAAGPVEEDDDEDCDTDALSNECKSHVEFFPTVSVKKSLSFECKEYWKYVKKLLYEEEFEELKKQHMHEKYVLRLAKKGEAVGDSSSPLSVAKCNWKVLREGRTEEEFLLMRLEIKNTKRRQKNQERRERFNLTAVGTLLKAGSQEKAKRRVLPFEKEVFKTSLDFRLDFLPVVVVRYMSKNHIGRLQDVERRVAEVVPLSPGNGANGRACNHGLSLGLTVAPGGTNVHGDGGGWSGSIHLNPHLKRHPALQTEVIELVTDIVLEYYGQDWWFIELMRCLGDIPDSAFLPGTRKIPASAIWWSHSPEEYHVHCDTNALGAVFVFTAVTAPGGELVMDRPCNGDFQLTKFHLSEGKIIGGRWGQFAHCNAPVVDSTIPRRSWVVYLDHRAISSSYRNMVPPKHNSTESIK
jgi:hypothetical protein